MTKEELNEGVRELLLAEGWNESDIQRTIENEFAPYRHMKDLVEGKFIVDSRQRSGIMAEEVRDVAD